jgi:hypothetical protein
MSTTTEPLSQAKRKAQRAKGPIPPAKLDEMAQLAPAEYGQRRQALSDEYCIGLKYLDMEYEGRRKSTKTDGDCETLPPDPEPWPHPVDGAELLDDIVESATTYLVLRKGDPETIALWGVFAHAHDCFGISPRLGVTSPTPECGKSTLVVDYLPGIVPRPLQASNVSSATIFRAIDEWSPSLLLDEADTYMVAAEEMRGILNSGHKRSGAFVIRCEGENFKPRRFSTWAPTAIALIGKLPPTLSSRSLHIEMRRKMAGDKVEPLGIDKLDRLIPLKRKMIRWVRDNAASLRAANPKMPASLHSRAADNWRPLLAIADLAGGKWPELARNIAMRYGRDSDVASIILLQDLEQRIFIDGREQVYSTVLAKDLADMEDRPWSEWRKERPITPRQMAELLEPFGIIPQQLWNAGKNNNGYKKSQFEDLFARYGGKKWSSPLDALESKEFSVKKSSREDSSLEDISDKKTSKHNGSRGLEDETPEGALEGTPHPQYGHDEAGDESDLDIPDFLNRIPPKEPADYDCGALDEDGYSGGDQG